MPVAGSPIISPEAITAYAVVFLSLLGIVYFIVARKRPPIYINHKIKLLVLIALAIKIFFVSSVGLIAMYWFVPAPVVLSTSPSPGAQDYSTNTKIEVLFSRPVSRKLLSKRISPDVPGVWVFESSLYATHLYRKLVFYPSVSLKPGTDYTIELSGIKNFAQISAPETYKFNFKTIASPKVASIEPSQDTHDFGINSDIKVFLTTSNDLISQFDFEFNPAVAFSATLAADKMSYLIHPKNPLKLGTSYSFKVQKSDLVWNLNEKKVISRGVLTDEGETSFVTGDSGVKNAKPIKETREVGIISSNPADGWTGVSTESHIGIIFNQQINKPSAEAAFSVNPPVAGKFSWQNSTMFFTPQNLLANSVKYSVNIASGVLSAEGGPSMKQSFAFAFTTEDNTYKLAVPFFFQQHGLSCEVAALKMALAFRGVSVSEETLLSQVGVDSTPHQGNVWGDPYNAFVGNVDGKEMVDGYGVYWGPIARVAGMYRGGSFSFSGWSIDKLTGQIKAGNPVVIWVYAAGGWPTSWSTPDGVSVYAVRDEHAVTVVGFVGSSENPSEIIVNDPLIGQVYWSRAVFDKKWGIFGQSGVVIN